MYQHKDWPSFNWDEGVLLNHISRVRELQGRVIGRLEGLGFQLREAATLETVMVDVLKSSEIEGEFLDIKEVRSSVAKNLGIELSDQTPSSKHVDGIVDMMLDATQKHEDKLTKERLFSWHGSMFSAGRSGLYTITVGDWRTDQTGRMQVVSGAMGKEKIHFVAPEASKVEKEMSIFLNWFNQTANLEPLIKAAVAHLWFITIHPFDDGNGRIARAISDMQVARADRTSERFYSVSAQIMASKNQYYDILESTQKGGMEITPWLVWYFERLYEAMLATTETLSSIMQKANFWDTHRQTQLNKRQILMINKLFDGFVGKLKTSKWAKINKVHRDTALRDIQDLVKKGILRETAEGGRSTNYQLFIPDR